MSESIPRYRLTTLPKERDEQIALLRWARQAAALYPALKHLVAIPNGLCASSIQEAARMKAQGMKSDTIPEYIAVSGLLKAHPQEEGGQRFIYFEASNESLDQQGERVLAKALSESAQLFQRHGNIDIDHETQLRRDPNWMLYEIGRPTAVRVDGAQTFVKAQLYQGDTDLARNANLVWDSLTNLSPPARWYPSVGGAVLEKGFELDPATKSRIALIKKVRWTNVKSALDKRCSQSHPRESKPPNSANRPHASLNQGMGCCRIELAKSPRSKLWNG